MNASQLYSGELYAYYEDPPRGKTPLGAAKVRLRATESRKSSWQTNRSTYAYVTVVQPGNRTYGHGKHSYCKEGEELAVPARHLVDFWTDYEGEARLLLEEQTERQRERRRAVFRESYLTNLITWKLQQSGMHVAIAHLDIYNDGSGFVKFQLAEMLRWLEIEESEVEAQVDRMMEA